VAGAITWIATMLQFSAIFGGMGGSDDEEGGNMFGMLAMAILAPIAATIIQLAISRSREFSADAGGAKIAGNPYGLVEALKKIDAVSKRVPLDANPATAHMFIIKPFSSSGLMALFSSHPKTEDRIRALLGGM
jgi:heat shock protein HtpX